MQGSTFSEWLYLANGLNLEFTVDAKCVDCQGSDERNFLRILKTLQCV